jgi:dihydroxyacid dehydratase/phosphogluconate dehydratase
LVNKPIYIVNDDQWGGYIPGTELAAATTRAFLETADVVHAIGGGNNTAVLLTIAVAQYDDVKVTFTQADMNHAKATRKGLDPLGPASKISLVRTYRK